MENDRTAGEVASRDLFGCPFCGEAPDLFPSPSGSGGDNYTLAHRCEIINVHLAWRRLETLVRGWNRRVNPVAPSRSLPSSMGYFWFRADPSHEWTIVNVAKPGYDVCAFALDGSRVFPYATAALAFPNWPAEQYGEWVPIPVPNSQRTDL
jgi:hypothetical protein